MLRTIKRPLAGVRLVPDHEVQHVPIELASHVDQIADMAPIHTDVMDRAFSRDANAIGERFNEELSKLRRGHFAGGESELGMPDAPAPADLADPQIVGRIAKHRRRRCAVHQTGEVRRLLARRRTRAGVFLAATNPRVALPDSGAKPAGCLPAPAVEGAMSARSRSISGASNPVKETSSPRPAKVRSARRARSPGFRDPSRPVRRFCCRRSRRRASAPR